MRNQRALLALCTAGVLGAAVLVTGCGSQTAQETTAAQTQAAAETTAAGETKAEETTAAGAETGAAESESTAEAADSTGAEETASAEDDYQKQIMAIDLALAQLNPVKPENLGNLELSEDQYTGLTLEVTEPITVTDDVVNEYLERLLPNYPAEVFDEVKDGDSLLINFAGTIDGEAFEGGTAENYPLEIGSGTFIPGFEDGLIGAHYGETVTLNLTFPEDYHQEDLAGKDVVFTVDVLEIHRPRTLADYNDETANEITEGEYPTAAEFSAYLKDALARNYKSQERQELLNAAVEQILEKCTAEPTDETVDWQLDSYLVNYNEAMRQSGNGFSLASMIYMYGQTFDQFRESMRADATEASKRAMVIYGIGEQQNIEVTDQAMQVFADSYGYDSVEALKDQGSEDEIRFAVLSELVTDYLEANNTVEYVVPDTQAATEAAEAAETEAAEAAEETAAEAETEAAEETAAEAETEETSAAQ